MVKKDEENFKAEDLKTEDKDDVNEEVQDEEELTISKEEYENIQRELEQTNTQLLRLQADFINFKKRNEKEKQDTIDYALEDFVCTLLPILDNFKLAMKSEIDKENGFYEGVNLIYKQLIDTLKNNGVTQMNALGEDFDPEFHNAVIMEESEEYETGKVIEVLQTGYLLKEKVIRPAMVKVAK